jgi:hypothetical protein
MFREFDRLFATLSHDFIAITYDQQAHVTLAGFGEIGEYNYFILGLNFALIATARPVLAFEVIYHLDDRMVYMRVTPTRACCTRSLS